MYNVARGRWAKNLKLLLPILLLALSTQACGSEENGDRRRSTASPKAAGRTRSPSPAGQSPGAQTNVPENETGQRRTIGGVETVVRGQASTLPGSVNVEANDNYFKPNILTGLPGTAIVASVKNQGKELHNFSVTGQEVNQDVKPGEAPSVVFTFPDSGRVVFFCKYHRDDGMVGELQAT